MGIAFDNLTHAASRPRLAKSPQTAAHNAGVPYDQILDQQLTARLRGPAPARRPRRAAPARPETPFGMLSACRFTLIKPCPKRSKHLRGKLPAQMPAWKSKSSHAESPKRRSISAACVTRA